MNKSPHSKCRTGHSIVYGLYALEILVLVVLFAIMYFFYGEVNRKIDYINETVVKERMHSDSISARMDSLDSHVLALHEITETNRSRSHQILVGTKIVQAVRKGIDAKDAANLARIIFDESEFNSTVEYSFLLAIIEAESKFNVNALSPAGAVGLGQLMPRTAESVARHCGMRFEANLLTDPRYNVKLSVHYLSRLYKQFPNYILVAAAYNGGPGGAIKYRQWMEGEIAKDSVHRETVAYVEKVMERYNVYRDMLH